MFKKGDKVWQKAGGPAMAVDQIDGPDRIWCQWWDQDAKEFKRDVFDPDVLTKDDPTPHGFAV